MYQMLTCVFLLSAASSSPSSSSPSALLVDEVNTKEVQQQRPQHKIRKRPLMRNVFEIRLVLRICLDAQTRREHELANACAEA